MTLDAPKIGCPKCAKLKDLIIHTFIIRRIVLNTMSVMMKYSNGVDSTILQSLYLTPTLSSGMYLSSGVALMAKSMHDFCKFIVLKLVA